MTSSPGSSGAGSSNGQATTQAGLGPSASKTGDPMRSVPYDSRDVTGASDGSATLTALPLASSSTGSRTRSAPLTPRDMPRISPRPKKLRRILSNGIKCMEKNMPIFIKVDQYIRAKLLAEEEGMGLHSSYRDSVI